MNNKGFAITTILYGTMVLFLLLILSTLAIAASYKDKLEILIENTNGARYILNSNKTRTLNIKIKEVPTENKISQIVLYINGTEAYTTKGKDTSGVETIYEKEYENVSSAYIVFKSYEPDNKGSTWVNGNKVFGTFSNYGNTFDLLTVGNSEILIETEFATSN